MVRLFIGILLGAAIVVFAAQNTGDVTYSFLFWQITAPRLLVLLVVYLMGIVTSWLVLGLSRLSGWRRKR